MRETIIIRTIMSKIVEFVYYDSDLHSAVKDTVRIRTKAKDSAGISKAIEHEYHLKVLEITSVEDSSEKLGIYEDEFLSIAKPVSEFKKGRREK